MAVGASDHATRAKYGRGLKLLAAVVVMLVLGVLGVFVYIRVALEPEQFDEGIEAPWGD